jgi:hypothetical protein
VIVEFVSKAKQKEAMQFLQDQLFQTPKWLVDNTISDYTGTNKLTTISSVQNNTLNRLISNTVFNKLFRFEAQDPMKAYTATEMLTDLRKGIWSELASHKSIDIYRRTLQKSHLEALTKLVSPDAGGGFLITFGSGPVSGGNSRTTDAISIVKAQLRILATEIRSALPAYKDPASRAHLQDVLDRINEALNPNK